MSTATATRERTGTHAHAALKPLRSGIEKVINPTSVTIVPIDLGTSVHSFHYGRLGGVSRGIRTSFLSAGDVDLGWASPTSVVDDEPVPDEPVCKTELDEALSLVREFERLADGWDEPTSLAPSSDVVEDALVVLQNWPISDLIPEPSVGSDGRIALELYDKEGFTLGGVEIIGERNAIFSIVKRTKILSTGRIDTTSQASILRALSQFRQHLE
jgi:hypothetical protein